MRKIYKKICIVVVVSFVVIFVILKLNIINIFSCPKVTAITLG